MADLLFRSFMQDPDAAARRQEIAVFFGPKGASYLAVYDRMHAAANRPAGEKMKFSLAGNGFNVGAFFLGPVWFFYRKLYTWGWGITGMLVVVGLLPGVNRIGIPIGIGLAVGANQLYVTHAVTTLARLRAAGGEPTTEQIAQTGGVSVRAGWIAGGIYAAVVVLRLLAIFIAGPTQR